MVTKKSFLQQPAKRLNVFTDGKNHTNQLWCLLGQDYKPLGHPPYQTERQAVSLSCLCPNGSFEQSLSNVLHTSRLRYSSDYTGEFDVLFICNGLNEK